MEVQHVVHSIREILEKVPLDRPELRNRFIIETNGMKNIPFHLSRYFNISFIYTNNIRFEACCVLQKTISIYTVIIIIKKDFETNFQQQEANPSFLSRDYITVCRRRELYCHELCHLVAITRAFPSYQSDSMRKNFFYALFQKFNDKSIRESHEKEFFQKANESFKKVLDGLKTMLDYNIPLSFNDFEDNPSEFDRDHFPYPGDNLNYFKLFSEFMASDKKLKKFMAKIPEYKRDGKIELINNYINWERCFCDLLHIDMYNFFRKAPEKRHIIIQEIQRL